MTDPEVAAGTVIRVGALSTTIFVLQFLVALDVSLVNIALPDIADDLGFGDSALQWVVSAYLLTFAGFMLLGGRLGDVVGRRRVVLVGSMLFAAASVLGGLAWNAPLLLLARAVQGLAGALLAPAALALVTEVPEGGHRRRALGLWSAAGAGGGAVGVVLSGLLTHAFGWRAVMFVNVPIVIVGLVAAYRLPNHRRASVDRRLDFAGACLATLGVGSLVYAASTPADSGWGAGSVVAGFVCAAVLLALFVVVESRVAQPLMPLRLFRVRSVVGANVFGFMLCAGQLAAFYFVSLYIQNVWGVASDVAGFMFLPFCFFVVVGIALASKMSAAIGPRITLGVFGFVGAAGLGCFALMPPQVAFWTGVVLPSALGGIGIGGSMVVQGAAAIAGVQPGDAGIASGVLNAARQLGGTLGLAVLVSIAATATASSSAASEALKAGDGYSTGLAVAAGLLIVGSVLAVLIVPSHTVRARPRRTSD
ncbi:MFS transporter [Rhodococcus sp. 14-2483-1-2]|uniref:MFS transporter n=1 Tax=Rhodococcus sp. 14-2483-1-2 TaxID=2023147 RepID=UPI000B9C5DF3|nr:MFS transporter [Rhodococcus sp. 14-2483-1-2]OZF26307.1 MFS transporter [Rhodococcus sp. 14-2483-1-2]